VRKDENGAYTRFDGFKNGGAVKWLAFPLKIGASWKYDDATTSTVTGLENVAIGLMTYKDCYHIFSKHSGGAFTGDEWVAPNNGLVKSEVVFADGSKRSKALVEFKPAK